MSATLVPALEAFARFRPDLSARQAEAHLPYPREDAMALVIEGDAVSEATGVIKTVDFVRQVTPAVAEDTVPAAIFVAGDIVAPHAILEEFDSDWSPMLKVLGSVKVRGLFLYGSDSEIDGDLVASEAVFGFYNHGRLTVHGALRADVLLDSDYTWHVDGPVKCRFILGDFSRANFEPTHEGAELGKVLVWDAVTDRDDVDYGFIWEALSRGDPILRPASEIGTPPLPQIGAQARERLAPLLERLSKGEAVEEVDLSTCQLRFVPEELRRFTALRRLSLKDNKIGALPTWLSELTRIESLDLRDCGLTRIPSGLGGLPVLRELYLDGNDISEGPKETEPFAALEILTIGSRYCFTEEAEAITRFTATIDFAGFPRIRSVHQVYGGEEIEYGPDSRLWASPTLESLSIGVESAMVLPPYLAEATALRVLTVSVDGARATDCAAVLARMPSLELVSLHIFSCLTREQFDTICAAVPQAFVRHWSSTELPEAEKALNETALYGMRQAEPAEKLAAADTVLAGMELRRCHLYGDKMDELLRFKTRELLHAALSADGDAAARQAAADWGGHLLAQIPDLGAHFWELTLTTLGHVRGMAAVCAILRLADRADILHAVAEARAKFARETDAAAPFVREDFAASLAKIEALAKA